LNYRSGKLIKDYARKPRVAVIVHRFPISLIMLALVLTTVFTLVLLRLNLDHKIEESLAVQADPFLPIEMPESVKPMLTEQPTKPNFTFPDILKQTEVKPVHVKVYESTPKDPTKKTKNILQVASFKNESDAKSLQKTLIRKQLTNAQVIQSTTNSGSVWYRVMVGPFQDRSKLNKAQDILVQMNFSPLERKQK
jgi:hypothetical protein